MTGWWLVGVMFFGLGMAGAQGVDVPSAAPRAAVETPVRDAKFGVKFVVPPGWSFTKRDHEVSTFRMDARSVPPKAEMRGVASMDFNPFPRSTLSGALVYFSVARHSNEGECARQPKVEGRPVYVQNIGGMDFLHGHDEYGGACVESRDEVYTAYRKGSCYRFDLQLHTFCSAGSGALEMTDEQMADVEKRMAGILSTVTLDWSKTGPVVVGPPAVDERKLLPKPEKAAVQRMGS